jgi:hypothetical protein
MHRGDLLTDLPALARLAPLGATLVIYHSAVLGYLSPAERRQFADTVRGLDAVWLSNDVPHSLDVPVPAIGEGSFHLIRDGRALLAIADNHGAWLHWLA